MGTDGIIAKPNISGTLEFSQFLSVFNRASKWLKFRIFMVRRPPRICGWAHYRVNTWLPLVPYIPTCLEISSPNTYTRQIWGLLCVYKQFGDNQPGKKNCSDSLSMHWKWMWTMFQWGIHFNKIPKEYWFQIGKKNGPDSASSHSLFPFHPHTFLSWVFNIYECPMCWYEITGSSWKVLIQDVLRFFWREIWIIFPLTSSRFTFWICWAKSWDFPLDFRNALYRSRYTNRHFSDYSKTFSKWSNNPRHLDITVFKYIWNIFPLTFSQFTFQGFFY